MDKTEKLVSIITPCYNGEKYVGNFLDSLLKQTYSRIELLFIDDNSTDYTSSIVNLYANKFEKKGYSLIYIKQNTNKGQSAAINIGLKKMSGEYVAWIDSDDIYYPDAIEDRVNFLEMNREIDFVLSYGEIVNENNLNDRKGILGRIKPEKNDNLFKDLLDEKNVVYGPGTILVRTESLKKSIPNLSIYESREGQNWQLMLPLAYCCNCGYIDRVQFKYVVHNDSHSHYNRSYKQLLTRRYNFYVLQKETIKNIPNMPDNEMKFWLEYIYNRMLFSQCSIALQSYELSDYKRIKKELLTRDSDLAKNKELNISVFLFNKFISKVSKIKKYLEVKK